MDRMRVLTEKVRELYETRDLNRSEWADWLYSSHVFLVADKARELAIRYGADEDLAEAAGMLHDIADYRMSRFDSSHEKESLTIARDLLLQSGFTTKEIEIVVDDSIHFHGCKAGKVPQTLEGKVMATADAVVHLTSDFYDFAKRSMLLSRTESETREWALPKIERDYSDKIFFDEIREEVYDDYMQAKELFSL